MAVKVETEMRTAVEAWRASDDEREQRLAAVDQTMQQIELVAAHAHRGPDPAGPGQGAGVSLVSDVQALVQQALRPPIRPPPTASGRRPSGCTTRCGWP